MIDLTATIERHSIRDEWQVYLPARANVHDLGRGGGGGPPPDPTPTNQAKANDYLRMSGFALASRWQQVHADLWVAQVRKL
ncbi:MAG: hypothetical protein V4755_11320 [Curtobacterium sp.]